MVTPDRRRQRYRPAVAPRAPAHPQQPRSSRWLGPAWGIGGFLLGIVFWHSLGFWSFVGEVVLKGPPDKDERQFVMRTDATVSPTAAATPRSTASLPSARPIMPGYGPGAAKAYLTCSVATAVPALGETDVTPCPPTTPPAISRGLARKGDRQAVAGMMPPPAAGRTTLAAPIPSR